MSRKPDYFLHVADDGTEIAYHDEPKRWITATLSVWYVQDKDGGQWEETLTRAATPHGRDWHYVDREDFSKSSRFCRPVRRREDLKWIRKRSDPGGQVRGRVIVKGRRQGRSTERGHA
jgi:hypothetical protein